MTIHPIFKKPFHIWWITMAIISIIKFSVLGFPTMDAYEGKDYGYIFWTIGTLLTGLIFASILYPIYWLIKRKWNNQVFMILITIMWFLVLVTY
tara:strand:+ start:464 stop:745 length:282 start_codon:yes stop_codon:yes gene_type:complete